MPLDFGCEKSIKLQYIFDALLGVELINLLNAVAQLLLGDEMFRLDSLYQCRCVICIYYFSVIKLIDDTNLHHLFGGKFTNEAISIIILKIIQKSLV